MKLIKYIFLLTAFSFCWTGCEIDEIPNPNGPTIETYLEDASKSQLQTLATGMESLLRQEIGFYYDVTSILGREYYFFTGSDPRYTGELLGKGEAQLDNAGFYGTRPYYGRYKTIKNGNILIEAAQNSNAIDEMELSGYLGFVKTFQAYEYLLALNLQYQNGIRIDVSNQENLGPFVDYDAALVAIKSLLDEADADLSAAGDAFPFVLSAGMTGFDDPGSFKLFNRAIKARVALYQSDYGDALSALGSSFMDMAGDLNNGPARFYSTAGGDAVNNIYRVPGQADAIIVHPSFIDDVVEGDSRLDNKVAIRDSVLALDGLSGLYDVSVFKSLDDAVSYINNKELILISAEANVKSGNMGDAVAAIDVIRGAAGLAAYAGAMDEAALMAEIRYQRRYSLFGEGHRWIDMRRWGLLDQLPLDREGDDVWVQFPRPVSETE